jgi:alpha-tubulin suppressor-like RCC1 family protein
VVGELAFAVLSLGDRHSCGVGRDGSLWCWGRNDRGQLGVGDVRDRAVPTRVGTASDWSSVSAGKRHTCGVRRNGALFCWGQDEQGQLGVGEGEDDRLLPAEVCGVPVP